MTWFKGDDAFWRHRKVRKLGRDKLSAVGLWELAGTWCCDNILTNVADGFVPREQVEEWDRRHRYARRLVDVGLWRETEVDGERGYLFHDWADYQPTRASVEAEREEWRTKKAAQRKGKPPKDQMSSGDTNGTPQETPPETSNGSPARFPDPIPVPVPSSGSFGREGPVGQRPRDNPPPPKCPKHINDPNPPACRACADARHHLEAWHTDQATAKAALAAELEQARADPRLRCHHGTDAGLHTRTDTGQSPCALCRTEQAAETPTGHAPGARDSGFSDAGGTP